MEAANYWSDPYSTLYNSNPQACVTACQSDARCAVASFHDASVKGYENQCALRPSIGPRHTEQAGITSWVKPPAMEQANYWYDPYKTLQGSNPAACISACQADSQCKVASFHDSSVRGYENQCVLRAGMGARHTDQPGITSWVKNHTMEAANYWVDPYLVVSNSDAQSCARLCAADSQCKVASFHDASVKGYENQCALRAAADARHTDQPGITSWTKGY